MTMLAGTGVGWCYARVECEGRRDGRTFVRNLESASE